MTFKQALKEAKGDKYYYDPKTKTGKLKHTRRKYAVINNKPSDGIK